MTTDFTDYTDGINARRFPADFVFRLTAAEAERCQRSKSQIAALKRGLNIKYLPYAYGQRGLRVGLLLDSQARGSDPPVRNEVKRSKSCFPGERLPLALEILAHSAAVQPGARAQIDNARDGFQRKA